MCVLLSCIYPRLTISRPGLEKGKKGKRMPEANLIIKRAILILFDFIFHSDMDLFGECREHKNQAFVQWKRN